MRILASNPDTIGDLVLRQPMYRALIDAGHALTLVIRPLLAPVVEWLFPGTPTIVCDADPYLPNRPWDHADLDAVADAARAVDPDLFVVAPFQWTRLEERLGYALPRAGKVMLTGHHFADQTYGPAPASRLIPTVRVDATEDIAELEKNRRLASAILGKATQLPAPSFEPTDAQRAAARTVLSDLGLDPGNTWVVCAGDTRWTRVRNWPVEHWARLLSGWNEAHGRRFLLVGHESEAHTSQEIIEAMGERSGAAALWSGVDAQDFGTLPGLLALARGYVGRDTGPMHLAAGLGRPVLAVFGGGTWPRFLPASKVGVSLTVKVPCLGCGWNCHLPEPYCIREVPVPEVRRAAEQLEAGAISTGEVRVLDPGPTLAERIAREGRDAVASTRVELSVTRRERDSQHQDLISALERAMARAGAADAVEAQVASERAALAQRESDLRARAAVAENRVRTLESSLASLRTDSEARLSQMQTQAQSQIAALKQDLAAAREESDTLRAAESDLRLQARRSADELAALSLLSRQQAGESERAKSDLARARAEIDRLRRELESITRQRDELLSSRWRRYGQKIGVVMVMPWERSAQNGKH